MRGDEALHTAPRGSTQAPAFILKVVTFIYA